jgi:hypothetical protein
MATHVVDDMLPVERDHRRVVAHHAPHSGQPQFSARDLIFACRRLRNAGRIDNARAALAAYQRTGLLDKTIAQYQEHGHNAPGQP